LRPSRPVRVQTSPRLAKSFRKLDGVIKAATARALRRLAENANHPSLNLEQLQGVEGVWSIRVNENFRVLLERQEDELGELFIAYDVANHDVYRRI
jgi:plasmid maintenance system killer protein